MRDATLELAERAPFNDLTVDQIARAGGHLAHGLLLLLPRASTTCCWPRWRRSRTRSFVRRIAGGTGRDRRETLIRSGDRGSRSSVYLKPRATCCGSAQEVAMYDPEVGELWQEIVGRFVTATAAHLRREQEAGRLRPLDVDAAAESLVCMMERCNYVYLGLRGGRSRRSSRRSPRSGSTRCIRTRPDRRGIGSSPEPRRGVYAAAYRVKDARSVAKESTPVQCCHPSPRGGWRPLDLSTAAFFASNRASEGGDPRLRILKPRRRRADHFEEPLAARPDQCLEESTTNRSIATACCAVEARLRQ